MYLGRFEGKGKGKGERIGKKDWDGGLGKGNKKEKVFCVEGRRGPPVFGIKSEFERMELVLSCL